MRSALCDDGKRRIMAKVEVAVDTNSITYYALAHPDILYNDSPVTKIRTLNKRQLFLLAKETLRQHGTEQPYELVADNYKNSCVEDLKTYIAELFPEID